MKAVRVHEKGMEGTKAEEVPVPTIGEGEVLVKMTLRPVNPADVFSILGVYPGFQSPLPAIPGLEGVGVVEESKSARFTKGDRVATAGFPAARGKGTWAEYVPFPEGDLIRVPASVSDEAAAQFLVNPVTVYGMLELSGAKAGDWVIQDAAGSTLGRQMISLCKHRGIHTINVVREARPDLVADLKALGADLVVEQSADVTAAAQEATGGRGCVAGFDAVAGDATAQLQRALGTNGTVFMYGLMSGMEAKMDAAQALFAQTGTRGFWLVPYLEAMDAARREKVFQEVMSLIETKVIKPEAFVGAKYSLDQWAEAIAHSQQPARKGKVFLA